MPLFPPNYVVGSTSTAPSGTGFTRSQTEPATRAIGDLWMEVNSSDFPKYGWLWRWDGLRWLSPDLDLNYSLLNVTARFDSLIVCKNFNYFFKSISSNSLHGYQQSDYNYWEYWLIILKTNNGFTPIFTEDTKNQNPQVWTPKTTPINIFIDKANSETNLFNLIVQPHSYTTYLFAAIQLTYNLSRLPSG
jgi:hypothetical protein